MLALMLTLAVSAATPNVQAPSNGSYDYTMTLSGTAIAKTTLAISQGSGVTTIVENDRGPLQGMAVSAKAKMTLGATLDPTAYQTSMVARGHTFASTIAVSGDTATLSGSTARSYKLGAGEKHFVILDAPLLAGFAVLPSQVHAWGAGPVLRLAPTYEQSSSLTFAPSAKPDRPSGVPANDVSLSIAAPLAFTEWYDPTTMVLDALDVPSQHIVVSRTH